MHTTSKCHLEKQGYKVAKSKKVVLLIVEGFSEEVLLYGSLRQEFQQYDIQFEIQRGDVLFSFNKNRKSIKGIIGDIVKEFLNKRKFKWSDILGVLHIIDTDGCLIPSENVRIETSQTTSTWYESDCIKVSDEKQRESIISRNMERSRNVRIMNSINTIINKKVPYQMFYFSRNLEHVLFDDPNPNTGTKIEEIERFVEGLSIPIEEFLHKHMYALSMESYEEKYTESWKVMDQNTASLSRLTNVSLLFEYIKSKT